MRDRPLYYKLVNKKPVPVYNILEIGDKLGKDEWRVNSSDYHGYWVSTVFLGIDHGFGRSEKPILFETMLFTSEGDSLAQRRCCTWDEAVKQHQAMLYQLAVELDVDISYIMQNVKEEFESKISKTEETKYSSADEFIADLIGRFGFAN